MKLSDYRTKVIGWEWTGISPKVTIEQLLNRTSGIHDDAEVEAGDQYSELLLHRQMMQLRNARIFEKFRL